MVAIILNQTPIWLCVFFSWGYRFISFGFVLLSFRYTTELHGYTLRRFGFALFLFRNVLLHSAISSFYLDVGFFHSVMVYLNVLFLIDYALI